MPGNGLLEKPVIRVANVESVTEPEPVWLERRLPVWSAGSPVGDSGPQVTESPLFDALQPVAEEVGIRLTPIDAALCRKIEEVSGQIRTNGILPFNRLQISFECEFFVLAAGGRRSAQFAESDRLAPDLVLETLDPLQCQENGFLVEIDDLRKRKLEAKTVPVDGWFPDSQESLERYFSFRAIAHRAVAENFPGWQFSRYSEHVHFSAGDEGGTVVRSAVDRQFAKLLEASLRAHWHDAYLLVEYFPRIRTDRPSPLSATINQVGDEEFLDHYFTQRDARRVMDPDPFHYEVRRTLPGSDAASRPLPGQPMILTQGLLLAAFGTALAAYQDPLLAGALTNSARQIGENPRDSFDRLITRLQDSEVLSLPCSLGAGLVEALVEPTRRLYETVE